jgi:putative spermidine/putrescine transport system ATP-binding protein
VTTTDAADTVESRTDPASGTRTGVAVALRDLNRRFGEVRALDGFSLDLAPGELVTLLGPSGCGKTTALRALAGLEDVDSGTVVVGGRDLRGVPVRQRDMGMVFQSYSLFPNLTARDNVAFGLRVRGQDKAARRRRADELLELVELAGRADRYPHQLSGGQQQRVALARALAPEPQVLLLDEPLSALDAKVRVALREQIRAVQTRLGTTTLFVTHDQEEALSISDRVGVMRDGRLEQIASPAELYARPATAFVAEFVGTMNHLPGTTTADGVEVLGRRLPATTDRPAGAEVDVLLRPEALLVTPDPRGSGVVVATTFLGAVTRVHVRLGETQRSGARPGQGETTVLVDRPSSAVADLAPGAGVTVEPAPDAQPLVA